MNREDPRTWIKYKSSLCKSCYATCCTMPVEVSAADLIRLELTTEEEAVFSLRDLAKRLKKEGWIQGFRPKTQIFTLSQKRGEDCIFLNNQRRCDVYEKRPAVCRKFPTQVGSRVGYCPYKPNKEI